MSAKVMKSTDGKLTFFGLLDGLDEIVDEALQVAQRVPYARSAVYLGER